MLLSEIAARLDRFAYTTAQVHGARAAAVSIVVVYQCGEYGVWLTKRSPHMREHPGQYVLPGGRLELGESHDEAALRELSEELGVNLSRDHVLGRLDDYRTRSGYVITPIVCWAGREHVIRPNPDEVSSVHFVPFTDLLTTPRFVSISQSERPVIQLPLLGVLIHAPTGAVLYQFAEVVLRDRHTRVDGFEEPTISWP
ncbi:CoA pyrophosphatase [Mycobacterium sp. pUA109]|uniref:CoA pyrophosphatase n=1 Tax=Mycobacterium sp. pUA109 TaxID=3238982 RepID=UPI00351B6361